MKLLILLALLHLLLRGDTTPAKPFDWKKRIDCPANNQSEDLKFVLPLDSDNRQTVVQTFSGMPFLMSCCATGYSHFTWYKDGVRLEPTSTDTYEYNDEETRSAIAWISLGARDCNRPQKSIYYECLFTCEAYSVDGQEKISENILITLMDELIPVPKTSEFLNASAENCLLEGEDLHLYCHLILSNSTSSFHETNIEVILENGTAISDLVDWTVPHEQRRIHVRYEGRRSSSVKYFITIFNVTSDFLNQTYTCQSNGAHRDFYVGECLEEIPLTTETRGTDSPISVKLGISISTVALMATIATILLVRFNDYARLWVRIHILQKFQRTTGYSEYDVYIICKDLSHPVAGKSVELLEDIFELNVCIADRDFVVGTFTAESIGESLMSSKKVVAFLTNDVFAEEQGAQDWSDVSFSLSLALNKPTLVVLLEDIDCSVLTTRKEIKAALKVLKSVKCTSFDINSLYQHYKQFFSTKQEMGQGYTLI